MDRPPPPWTWQASKRRRPESAACSWPRHGIFATLVVSTQRATYCRAKPYRINTAVASLQPQPPASAAAAAATAAIAVTAAATAAIADTATVMVWPYINLLYRQRGLGDAQIGVLAALKPWVSAPAAFVWAAAADRFSAHRAILLATFITSTIVRTCTAFGFRFWQFLVLAAVGEALASPVGVMADAAVVAASKRDTDYGRSRLWCGVSLLDSAAHCLSWSLGLFRKGYAHACMGRGPHGGGVAGC